MTLTELRYVVALARERHFGRAAEACFVSQPTLSVAIKKLEEELDVKIFERASGEVGVTPLGEIVSYGQVAGPDTPSLLQQPSRAILSALAKRDMSVSDLDLFEINEAFAAVGLASMADLGVTDEIVNVNGGAIALGHPIGMSGNRVALTLLHELRRRGGGTGAAALCGGGGQGDAIVVRTVS